MRGKVVLNMIDPALVGTRFLVIEPITSENLAQGTVTGGGKQLIVADHLAPGEGEIIGFVEGREASNPYYPGRAAVDAYCSMIVDTIDYDPQR